MVLYIALATIILLALFIFIVLLLNKLFIVCIVQSKSMFPSLKPGDRIVVFRYWQSMFLRKGTIILIEPHIEADAAVLPNPYKPIQYVKRLVALPGDTYEYYKPNHQQRYDALVNEKVSTYIPENFIFVLGDFSASYDSRYWGPIPLSSVIGVVVATFPVRKDT